jgi:hypothetical protein
MKCSICGKTHQVRWFTRTPDPVSFNAALAAFGVMLALAIAFFSLAGAVPVLVIGCVVLAKAMPTYLDAKIVVLDATAIHAGGRRIAYVWITSIDREGDHLVVNVRGSLTRIALPAHAIDDVGRHAQARLIVARLGLRKKVERVVREAMLAHGSEAVIYRRRLPVEYLTIEEARRAGHARIFVRHELVGTYRTPHDPRFVLVTPR